MRSGSNVQDVKVGLLKTAQTDPFCFIFVKTAVLMTTWIKILLPVYQTKAYYSYLFGHRLKV